MEGVISAEVEVMVGLAAVDTSAQGIVSTGSDLLDAYCCCAFIVCASQCWVNLEGDEAAAWRLRGLRDPRNYR